ncbi:hypothetical protein [Streptomyces sp. UG1]|uniref:hypothetical protein n=1 Tax=Streptomyces sp. UG1 TaxID=3417652 RepID=UPI003CF7E7E3
MARHRFGGVADYIITVGTDDAATLEPNAQVTCWNAATSGTQYTDLTETDGVTPISGGVLTADATGSVPEFMGPDGVRSIYLDANGGAGPRRRTVATDVGDDLTTAESDITSHTGAANPHATEVADLTDARADPAVDDVKGGGVLTYDALTSRWRPDGSSKALQGFHAGLANRHFQRCNIVCIGDSITEGQGATAFANSWPSRLRQLLRARFPTDGNPRGDAATSAPCRPARRRSPGPPP